MRRLMLALVLCACGTSPTDQGLFVRPLQVPETASSVQLIVSESPGGERPCNLLWAEDPPLVAEARVSARAPLAENQVLGVPVVLTQYSELVVRVYAFHTPVSADPLAGGCVLAELPSGTGGIVLSVELEPPP